MSVATTGFTRRFFHEFFPPPKFLEMPAVGLDVSDAAVTALELVRKRGASAVGRYGRRPLPRGAVADGYVHDKERVVAELRALKKDLRLSFVNASLPEEKAYLYTSALPPVSAKEIRGAIELTLEENVPLSPGEALFDYRVLENKIASPNAVSEIAVTVLPRAVVRTYTELFSAAELVPLSFELRAQAVCRAVILHGDRGAYLVLALEAGKAGIFIVRDEAVRFTATVALREASSSGASEERGAIRPNFAAEIRAEVLKHIAYWQTHADSSREAGDSITSIVLCGREEDSALVAEELSHSLAVPVETANIWRNGFSFDEYIPPILSEESFEYAAAVGLALPKSQ
jgi:hypothetical protein